ncbi:MAG: DUF1501 domain-containing protein [Oligoflexia bacterium]|nr:DUF1501 domain-containing protein [Oligoflexia bacterium]
MKISRRAFNKLIPTGYLALSTNQLSYALENSHQEMNYIQINMFGSPSRWYFDSILKPYDESPFVSKNKMITTSFSSDGINFKSEYKTIKYKGLNVPRLWNEKLISSKEKLSSIFDQALIVRGCDMILDGHENISRKLVTPFQGGESLTGRLTDLSNTPLPTVQFLQESSPLSSTPGAFSSKQNKAAINLFENQDYFEAIFIDSPKIQDKPKQFIKRINKMFGITELTLNRLSKLNQLDIQALKKNYEKKLNSYNDLIAKCRHNFKNLLVFSNPISGYKINKKEYDSTEIILNAVGPYHSDGKVILDNDLLTALDTIVFPRLADQFAMTELLMENKLTKSFVLMLLPPEEILFKKITNLDNLQFKSQNSKNVVGLRDPSLIFEESINFTFDTHDHGLALEYLINNAFFYTLANCIDQFRAFLKDNNSFDQSLIHIVSEFERTPKYNLAGSDHGFQGHTSTFIGGMFKDLSLTGNIVTNSRSKHVLNNDNGTWGMASPIKGLGNRTISYRNVLNSICDILKVPRMSKTDASLIFKEKNYWKPIFKAENIADG